MSAKLARVRRHILRTAPAGVLRELEEGGWSLDVTGAGHVRWQHPGGAMVYAAGTPSDRRAWANHLANLRRARRRQEGP